MLECFLVRTIGRTIFGFVGPTRRVLLGACVSDHYQAPPRAAHDRAEGAPAGVSCCSDFVRRSLFFIFFCFYIFVPAFNFFISLILTLFG